MKILRQAFDHATALGVPGGALGALVGLLAAILEQQGDAMAHIVAGGYVVLAALFPLALGVNFHMTRYEAEQFDFYASVQSFPAALLGALLGVVIGSIGFFVLGINLPIILRGVNAAEFYAAVRDRIFWNRVLWVTGITAVTSLLIAGWFYWTAYWE